MGHGLASIMAGDLHCGDFHVRAVDAERAPSVGLLIAFVWILGRAVRAFLAAWVPAETARRKCDDMDRTPPALTATARAPATAAAATRGTCETCTVRTPDELLGDRPAQPAPSSLPCLMCDRGDGSLPSRMCDRGRGRSSCAALATPPGLACGTDFDLSGGACREAVPAAGVCPLRDML